MIAFYLTVSRSLVFKRGCLGTERVWHPAAVQLERGVHGELLDALHPLRRQAPLDGDLPEAARRLLVHLRLSHRQRSAHRHFNMTINTILCIQFIHALVMCAWQVMKPIIDKVAFVDSKGWVHLKIVAGIKQPCRPKLTACCLHINGTFSYKFIETPPCIWAPKGFQAWLFLHTLWPFPPIGITGVRLLVCIPTGRLVYLCLGSNLRNLRAADNERRGWKPKHLPSGPRGEHSRVRLCKVPNQTESSSLRP